MNNARVIITTQCSLNCSYCCNKIPEVQQSFRMTTMSEFCKMKYDNVNITGGEPMLAAEKMRALIDKLSSSSKLFLYTNGYNSHLARYFPEFRGVNIGCHGAKIESLANAMNWKNTGVDSVRLHIQNHFWTPEFEEDCTSRGIQVVQWRMNECSKSPEDRWIV